MQQQVGGRIAGKQEHDFARACVSAFMDRQEEMAGLDEAIMANPPPDKEKHQDYNCDMVINGFIAPRSLYLYWPLKQPTRGGISWNNSCLPVCSDEHILLATTKKGRIAMANDSERITTCHFCGHDQKTRLSNPSVGLSKPGEVADDRFSCEKCKRLNYTDPQKMEDYLWWLDFGIGIVSGRVDSLKEMNENIEQIFLNQLRSGALDEAYDQLEADGFFQQGDYLDLELQDPESFREYAERMYHSLKERSKSEEAGA